MMRSYIILAVLVCAAFIGRSDGVCDLVGCTSKLVTGGTLIEMCKSYTPYLKCLETTIQNSDCPEELKKGIQDATTMYKDKLKDCDGVAGLVSSLALCLALSGVTYFLTSFR